MSVTYNPYSDTLIYRASPDSPTEHLYTIFQINGQKFVKHFTASSSQQPKPERDSEIFACNIPRAFNIVEVFRFFCQVGQIYQLRLLMDFSGFNRGKCFVQYFSARASREAVCCLHDEPISRNSNVVVKLSLDNNQLILKSIPADIGYEDLRAALRELIGEGLKKVTLRPSMDPRRNVCYCKYESHRLAIMAHKKAWPYLYIRGALVDVHWATPQMFRTMSHLYFNNFPRSLTKKELFAIIISKIEPKRIVSMRINERANCGLITLTSMKDLKTAQLRLLNLVIQGLKLNFSTFPFNVNANEAHAAASCRYNDENNENIRTKDQYKKENENQKVLKQNLPEHSRKPSHQIKPSRPFQDITNNYYRKD